MLLLVCLAGCGRESGTQAADAAAPAAGAASPGVIVLPPGSPKLARIRVADVELRDFPIDEVIAPGRVELDPNRVSRILMPVAGRIRRVLVKLGDTVEEGQPVLAIDSADAGAALTAFRQAQSQLRQAQANLNKAIADQERLKDLYDHRAAALKDLQSAQNELAQAHSAADQVQAALDDAQHRLDVLGLKADAGNREVAVRAPLAGKILEIAVAPGEFRNDTSTPLMTIADLRSVWVAADVPENLIRKVEIGEGLELELYAYPGEQFRGRVMRIADTVDPQTRTIKVQAEIQNPAGRLRPEMFGRIRHSHGSRRLPVVPSSAVVQSGGRAWVFVALSPREFKQVPVTIGENAGAAVPVLAGLAAGARVVVDGAMLLHGDAGGER